MPDEFSLPGKGVATLVTLMRLFSSVNYLMIGEV
jgi:hypothetical protein